VLFGYPVAATTNNWLHDCLVHAVRTIHAAVDGSMPSPGWPNVVPAAYRDTLKKRSGLRDRLKAYDDAVRTLSKPDRDAVLNAVGDQNRLAELLSGTCACASIDALHVGVREPVKNLFDFAFGLLTDLNVRDDHYMAIYDAAAAHVCPFCGAEYFDAPGAPREAMDHYLAKSRYPFAAANLRNLVPMGNKCNSRYKLATDLLWREDGSRRVAFDPYDHERVEVLLEESEPFGGDAEYLPNWVIQFRPESPQAETWDEVFSIRARYRRDHLNPGYEGWLKLFAKSVRTYGWEVDTDEDLGKAILRYAENWEQAGVHDRAFLKAAVFRMLHKYCKTAPDNGRLISQLRDLLSQA
jgi:hypothetical protein